MLTHCVDSNRFARACVLLGITALAGAVSARAQVNTTYTFSHLAGPTAVGGAVDGTGPAARFVRPSGLAIDSLGVVYVADTYSGTIRKISSGGAVTTFAGSPGDMGNADGTAATARFSFPTGLALDSARNIYVADRDNNSIRKVTTAGAVTTFAGSTLAGSSDGRGSAARFNHPSSLAIDGQGNVYVADTLNDTIRKIDVFGSVSTLAGSAGLEGSTDGLGSAARFSRPTGIAIDSSGALYVADTGNSTIRKITPAGAVTTLAGTAGQPGTTDGVGPNVRFYLPTSITVDSAGNVFVTDGSATVREVTATGIVSTLAGSPGIAGSADGSSAVARFAGPGGGIAIDASGRIYIADTDNNLIRAITATGTVSTIAGAAPAASVDASGSSARFVFPRSIAADAVGNTYITDSLAHTIRKVSLTGSVTTLAGNPGQPGAADGTGSTARFASPSGIAVDRNGNLYVADTGNQTIRVVNSSGTVSTLAGTPGLRGSTNASGANARFDHPSGIAVDSSGNVYVSDEYNHVVRKITSGAVTTLAGSPGLIGSTDGLGSSARFYFPGPITVDASSNVYVADRDNVIRKISISGTVTTLAGTSGNTGAVDGTGASASFDHITGLSVDASGTLFVTDANNNAVRRITAAGVVSTIGGKSGAVGSADGPGASATFNQPYGIAVDTSGNLYVADTYNAAIRKGTPDAATTPVISAQPIAQAAITGGRAVLAVTANNAISYQWSKDGVAIAGATSSTLVITNAQASDAGTYRVMITGTGGSVQSDPVAVSVTPLAGVRLVNISTRSYVGTGSDVMIAGFIIGGTAPKTVLIRASGPALAQFGLSGLLADPMVDLYSGNTVIASNDNWGDDTTAKATISQASLLAGSFAWTDGSRDAAIVTTLSPGAYTAIVSGKSGTTGLALIEVFELDLANGSSSLINISTRSSVRTDAGVQIAGFVVAGTAPKKVIIRASGPALTKYGVTGILADPVLELHDATTTLTTNDDWPAAARVDFQKSGVDNWDVGSKDAAIVTTLNPGAYTAIVSGKGNTTGVALIEVFEAQ